MIGTTGQGYNDGLRFIQFYYALPLAMIILSVTLVPFFYNSGVYTAYEYLERRFDAQDAQLHEPAVPDIARDVLRRGRLGAGGGAVARARMEPDATSLAITMPAVVYTMFGGVQAVTWTDVKIMVLIVFGMFAIVVAAILGFPADVGLADGLSIAAATGRLQDVRLLVRSDEPVHVLVRHDRRAVPVLLLLRHRPEPGAALPDGAIGRRGAALAADERVLEDPAAAPRARARRPGLRLLRLQSAAAALQPGSRRAAEARRAPRRPTRRCRSEFDAAFDARRDAAADAGGGARLERCRRARAARRRAMRQRDAALQSVRRSRRRSRARDHRRPHASPT